MRQHRHPSLIRHLLPDHHVYVRTGSSSSYVVLSWPWRVGVGLGLAGLVLWTSLASYGWVTAHIEAGERGLEIARLAEANQRLKAVADAAYARGQAGATSEIARLVVDLEETKAGRGLALSLVEAAAAEAPHTEHENKTDGLAARLLPAAIDVDGGRHGRDWLYDRLARQLPDGAARTAEVARLRAQLRAARAEIARLRRAPGEHEEAALR